MPIDLDHKPSKKLKIVTHFPNELPIPKEIQRWVGKGLKEVTDDDQHNHIIDLMEAHEPIIHESPYELHLLGDCVVIYDDLRNIVWATKDSEIHTLMPGYWENIAKK